MTETEIQNQILWFESLLEMVEAGKTEAVRAAVIAAIKVLERGITEEV